MSEGKEMKGIFQRINTREGFEDDAFWQEGYTFYGSGFTNSPAVLEVGTFRQHATETLKFLGENGE